MRISEGMRDIQSDISRIVTRIIEQHRKRRHSLIVDLAFCNFSEDGFRFRAEPDNFNREVVMTWHLWNGNYNEKTGGFSFWFKLVIEQNERPTVVTYSVLITSQRKVRCIPYEFENDFYRVKAEEIDFFIE
jgi:hypothetical protein